MVRFGWLLGAVLLLAGAAIAVEFDTGSPITLNVRASAYTVGPAQTVQIHIEGTDMDLQNGGRGWERVNDPVTLAYEVSGGSLAKHSVTANPVDLIWQAPMQPGVYALYVTATDGGRLFVDRPARRIVEFTVQQAGVPFVPGVRVAANPQTIRLDQRNNTMLTAQVFGENTAGKSVRFFATSGALSAATAVTNADGRASVRLTVTPNDTGTITVAASQGNTTSTTTVQVVENAPGPIQPGPPIYPAPPPGNISPGFVVNIEPNVLPADGRSRAIVRVRITDARGLPIQRQNVVFRSTIGSIAPRMSLTDYYGGAVAEITASNEPSTGYVVVNAGPMQSYATIMFTPVEGDGPVGPPRIFLTVDPTQQNADGAARVRVEALVLDGDSRAITDAQVNFSTTLGRITQPTVTTDEEGRAATTLIAPDRPGLAVVTAAMDRLTAASQVEFLGGDGGDALFEVPRWTGQRTAFAAPKWLLHELHVEAGGRSVTTAELRILDDTGKPKLQVSLGANGVIVRDQFGLARGYAIEEKDIATVVLLRPDGALARSITIPLAIGSDIREVQYAEPGGQVLVAIAQPDGTRPEVRFYGPNDAELFTLNRGLEQLPVMALGGDGYLAMALAGGTVRLYNPTGLPVSDGRRTDGLAARAAAVGPGGAWLAVSAALAGQTARPPVVSIFSSKGGAPIATFELDAVRMAPVSASALVVSTPDSTAYLNLAGNNIAWKIAGGFERFLATGNLAVLAGHHNAESNGVTSRVTIVQLRDGRLVLSEPFDTGRIIALTPPGADGTVGVLGEFYALEVALPVGR
jgi:hypothetical protein